MTRTSKRPFDVIVDTQGTWIVSRTGKLRRWSPRMYRGIARRRARFGADQRMQVL